MENWKKDHKFLDLGDKIDISANALGIAVLLKDLLQKPYGHLSEFHEEGSVEDGSVIIEKMKEIGGRLIYKYISDNYDLSVWLWNESIIETELSNNNYLRIKGSSQDEAFVINLRKLCSEHLTKKSIDKGQVFAIVKNGPSLSLQPLGNAGIALIHENYSPDVIEGYKFVVKDLNSSHPSGRIIILEGTPGTGKTHIVRSWLMDVSQGMFVLISPEMVSSLGGPELLPLLLAYRNNANGPIILVLEDADKCLVTRQGDNINSIQSLLNLGDGILGSMLDLRIIATTNAKKLEMESALLRPGRLSKRIEVGPLDASIANSIFKRLLPDQKISDKLLVKNKKYTLAEVYSIAREHGWFPAERPKLQNELSRHDDDDDPNDYYD